MSSKVIETTCKFPCRKRSKYKAILWHSKGLIKKKLIKRGTFKEKVHVDMEIISIKDESGYLPIVLHVHGSSAVGGLTFVSLQ